MKKLLIFTACLAAACATTGTVVDRTFTDSTYNFRVTAPDFYLLRPGQKGSDVRLQIFSTKFEVFTQEPKPLFAVCIEQSDLELEKLAEEEAAFHFDPRYYYDYKVAKTVKAQVQGFPALIVRGTSELRAETGRNYKTATITAYIKLPGHYLKIEYVAYPEWYNYADFDSILKNIDLASFKSPAPTER